MISVAASADGGLFLAPGAAERIRLEIARARGNEVSFLALVGEGGELREPRVVSRGNTSAVLAAVRDPKPGGVLLHNHPSGSLEPSHADLGVAERIAGVDAETLLGPEMAEMPASASMRCGSPFRAPSRWRPPSCRSRVASPGRGRWRCARAPTRAA